MADVAAEIEEIRKPFEPYQHRESRLSQRQKARIWTVFAPHRMTTDSALYIDRHIDRPVATDFLIALDEALKAPSASPFVFHAHGVGGVGKSRLQKKVEDSYQHSGMTARIEFDFIEPIDPIKVMQRLYQELLAKSPKSLQSGKPDPFGERYQQYFDAIHKLKTESEDGKAAATPEQIEAVKKGVSWLAKGAGGLVLPEFASETIGQVAGAAVEGAKLALSEKDRWLDLVRQHHVTKGKRALQELVLQPVDKLTEAFRPDWTRQVCSLVLPFASLPRLRAVRPTDGSKSPSRTNRHPHPSRIQQRFVFVGNWQRPI